ALDTGYPAPPATEGITPGLWRFEDGRPITIVVAQLPAELRQLLGPYTDPDDPQYVELYTYADVDSLVELHGHIRAVNPDSEVGFRTVSALRSDDFTTHLALLGGVDWNVLTRDLLKRLPVPVSQVSPEGDPASGGFEVVKGGERRRYHPVFTEKDGRKMLVEDVAHFFRAPNPFNRKRTVTICNGMFSRGTYGAVRALTDSRFRDRNAEYIHERFPRGDTFSILTRVPILNGEVLTPDWTLP